MPSGQEFDFIVVGAGTTGCVVASRLSARGYSVLLLEAGVSDLKNDAVIPPVSELPLVFQAIFGLSKKYQTVQQPSLGRDMPIRQAAVRGGGSSINGMLYVRGNRRDYDHWEQLGNRGWSYSHVLPYFIKSENFAGGASKFHGVDGPLHVRRAFGCSAAAHAFIDAARQVFPQSDPTWDFNGQQQEHAAGLYHVTVSPADKRASSAVSFIGAVANRSKLDVQLGVKATKILIENKRAVGVECEVDGAPVKFFAGREVIVSAGTFESPKLLMLSGIGPADHLRERGIRRVESDLPGVGQNLHDHLQLLIYHPARVNPGEGAFTAEAGLFMNTDDTSKGISPDLQFHVLGDFPGPPLGAPPGTPPDKPSNPDPGHNPRRPTFIISPVLCKPQSRGTLRLNIDPHADPLIDPNFLQCDADMKVLVRGIAWAEHFAKMGELGKMLDRSSRPYAVDLISEPAPDTTPAMQELPDPSEYKAFIKRFAQTVWHPVGTCKMGTDPLAVVDPHLLVRGIERLRVADASVMPVIPSGNTNAACYMIGEVCADLIP